MAISIFVSIGVQIHLFYCAFIGDHLYEYITYSFCRSDIFVTSKIGKTK